MSLTVWFIILLSFVICYYKSFIFFLTKVISLALQRSYHSNGEREYVTPSEEVCKKHLGYCFQPRTLNSLVAGVFKNKTADTIFFLFSGHV